MELSPLVTPQHKLNATGLKATRRQHKLCTVLPSTCTQITASVLTVAYNTKNIASHNKSMGNSLFDPGREAKEERCL